MTSLSLVAQMVKRLPAMWETRVRSLGQEEGGGESFALDFTVRSLSIILHGAQGLFLLEKRSVSGTKRETEELQRERTGKVNGEGTWY